MDMELNEELQKVVDALPVYRQILDDVSFITVWNDESVVVGYSIPAGEKPMVNVGDVFKDPSGCYDEVIRTGQKKFNYLPKEVMGTAFEGYLAPIKDHGKVVGVISYTYSAAEKEQVRDMTKEFHQAVTDIDESINGVLEGFEQMFGMLTDMNTQTEDVESDVKDATGIVKKISSNASRSNILALNASIEAARSGEAGRGFTVVAKEMGKLASDSGSSAKEIDNTLLAITKHLEEIVSSIHGTNDIAKEYLDNISEVKEKLGKTLELANELQDKLK